MALDTTLSGENSDSYVTLAEYQARADALGWTLHGSDAREEEDLRNAAIALDISYTWRGIIVAEFQARAWPRYTTNHSGYGYSSLGVLRDYPIRSDRIPREIKEAQMEMAFLIQNGATPLATVDGVVKRKREKLDVLEEETEYFGGQGIPRYPSVDRLLRRYIVGGPGQAAMVRG